MLNLFTLIFGDANAKRLKSYEKDLVSIKKIEAEYREIVTTVDQVQAKTHEFQTRFTGLDVENYIVSFVRQVLILTV